jgi:hypothetical protein
MQQMDDFIFSFSTCGVGSVDGTVGSEMEVFGLVVQGQKGVSQMSEPRIES